MVYFILDEEFFSCIFPFDKLSGQLTRSCPLLFYFSLSDFVAIFEGKCHQEFFSLDADEFTNLPKFFCSL
jgi:hypothetical protein